MIITFAAEMALEFNFYPPLVEDKAQHYIWGRYIGVCVFAAAFVGVVTRLLLPAQGSLTLVLMWIPAFIAGFSLLAAGVVTAVALGKEAIDSTGFGYVEWEDVVVTVEGVASLFPAVAIVMAVTPFFIPADILLQLPKLMLSDVKTGIRSVDSYARELKSHRDSKYKQVLVLEDDIIFATVVMEGCRREGLACKHLSDVRSAHDYFMAHKQQLKLLIVDNFVRADERGGNCTGGEWVAGLAKKYPKGERSFKIAMVSGHTELLKGVEKAADVVFEKPIDGKKLHAFLQTLS